MDIACLDLGCISMDKQSPVSAIDFENMDANANQLSSSSFKSAKNKSLRESQSKPNILNKFTAQIRKPSHRKSSPLYWFPRKKVDSYLKRKIQKLQEISGMSLTLDETLGDSNPHYSRVLREKIAAREAAQKAMEDRKAALVEASWCRILRAARIQSKEAEALLLKAEKTAAEAFEAAAAMGVILYDKPNFPEKTCKVEMSSVDGVGSTTHTVTASFETAFEVDKEVHEAVKTAFIILADCPSFNKDVFKDLLRKISENPDAGDNNNVTSEFSSECESESGSELDTMSHSHDMDLKVPDVEKRQKRCKRRQFLEKLTQEKLVNMMVERLRCLGEAELSSLATIVATCGLNAVLAEVENSKLYDPGFTGDCPPDPALRRASSFGSGKMTQSNLETSLHGRIRRRKQPESELPSLDKFLVMRMTKLESEVQEAKNSRRNESKEGTVDNEDKSDDRKVNLRSNKTSYQTLPDLGSILVKRSSRFEREINEAKKNSGYIFETRQKGSVADISSTDSIPELQNVLIKHSSRLEKEIEEMKRTSGITSEKNIMKTGRLPSRLASHEEENISEVPSLDKFLVKHVTRLEKEVQEARNGRNNDLVNGLTVTNLKKKGDSSTPYSQFDKTESFSFNGGRVGKENIDPYIEVDQNSEVEKMRCEMNLPLSKTAGCTAGKTLCLRDTKTGTEEVEDSLDKILVKPVHWLEREKMQALSSGSIYGNLGLQKKHGENNVTCYESLDKVLVKHVSRLEKEKMRFNATEEVVNVKKSDTSMRCQMNEEGGLGQILVMHKSRLEREKMAAAQQPGEQIRFSVSRREARERELHEAWGGLSLGNSIRPSFSKLERDKAAWVKAEEEERKQASHEGGVK